MNGRKNTKKKSVSRALMTGKKPVSRRTRENTRFSVSLIVLMAFLISSVLLLLISLNSQSLAEAGKSTVFAPASGSSSARKISQPKAMVLDDQNLEFRLTIPPGWEGWTYKIGYIKSPVDDTLSDQYVRVFLPGPKSSATKNLDEQQVKVMTIVKYTVDEWKALSKGCEKENIFYCEMMGSEISRKGDSVFAHLEEKDLPENLKPMQRQVGKIIESFQLR